jgi:hypothetical protein
LRESLLQVDDRREDGNCKYQNQPFEVAPGQEAREVHNQDENRNYIKQRKQHFVPPWEIVVFFRLLMIMTKKADNA